MSTSSIQFMVNLAQASPIVDVAACGVVFLALLSRHKSSARMHYYLLELAVICGIIYNALLIDKRKTKSSPLDTTESTAAMGMMSTLSSLFTQLAGLWALHIFAAIYIGGRSIIASIFSFIGTLWVMVTIVLSVIIQVSLAKYKVLAPYTMRKIVFWSYPAVSIWSLFALLVIGRLSTLGSHQHYGEARGIMMRDWSLLGSFIFMVAIYNIWLTVITLYPFTESAYGAVELADLILSTLFTRLSILLFVGFYYRLSVMLPLEERIPVSQVVPEEEMTPFSL
jgi:hypothetical protein